MWMWEFIFGRVGMLKMNDLLFVFKKGGIFWELWNEWVCRENEKREEKRGRVGVLGRNAFRRGRLRIIRTMAKEEKQSYLQLILVDLISNASNLPCFFASILLLLKKVQIPWERPKIPNLNHNLISCFLHLSVHPALHSFQIWYNSKRMHDHSKSMGKA